MATIHRHVSLDTPDQVTIIVKNHWAEDTNKEFEGNQINDALIYARTLTNNSVIKKESIFLCSCESVAKETMETLYLIRTDTKGK